MSKYTNIVVAVDSIGALSDGTLENNLFLMDDGPWTSSGQGTTGLATLCTPGQVIQWVVYPIDLQTAAEIYSIEFNTYDNTTPPANNSTGNDVVAPDLNSWTGIVPATMVPGLKYHYRLGIRMGVGPNSIMYTHAPALVRV